MGQSRDPGWHPDPTGRFDERLWNGRRWTPRVRIGAAEAIEAASGTPSGEDGQWRPDPTRRFEQRLWQAGDWTRRVRVGSAEAMDTVSVPTSGRATRRQRQADAAGPGWRPDPDDPALERFWDGRQLSAKTRPAGGDGGGSARLPWWGHPAVPIGILLILAIVAVLALVTIWLVT